jgi:calreticulin
MFGPDVCGATFQRTHVILGHKGEHHPTLHPLNCIKDHLTHSYTLIIRANNTYEVYIDGEVIDASTVDDRFAVPAASVIPDPTDRKPADWDDDKWVIDPTDTKPRNWVKDEFIPDPDAFKPPSWDDSIIWGPPMIKNSNYKGQWAPRVIKNPKYGGVWMPRTVKQDVERDPTFGHFPQVAYLGLKFFQNHPVTIFDNFLVTNDEKYARKMLEEVFLSLREAEVRNFDDHSRRVRKEREIEEIWRDVDKNRHHDHDAFSDSESQSEDDYFQVRKNFAKQKNKPKKVEQFDTL